MLGLLQVFRGDTVAVTLSGQILMVVVRGASNIAVGVAGFLDHVGVLANAEAVFMWDVWVDAVLVRVVRRPGEVVTSDLKNYMSANGPLLERGGETYLNIVVGNFA